MTKQDMLRELDVLRELTNDTGKRIVDGLKASLSHEEAPTPVLVFDAGRRHDARDPGETEQHKAEKLRLA